jgi:hypothetical protein
MISIIVPTEYTYHFPTTYTSVKQILLPVTRPLHNNTSEEVVWEMAPTTRGATQPLSGFQDNPEVLLNTLSEGGTTPTRTPNDTLTLDERIQAAEQRRDELLRLQRLQALEAEIALLEATPPTATPSTVIEALEEDPVSEAQERRKRNAPQALTPPHVKRTLKPKDPAEYKGRTLKEHREFFRSCEIAFRLLPLEFRLDKDKVLWAMQYLAGDPRELWYTHYERTFAIGEETLTWGYFKDYMLDLLSDPINRTLEAATAHAHAMQRRDQTVRAFATYLEVLEEQLTPYTEEQRVQHLFSKLKPELQRAITNYHQVPATREDLVALGSTLERNLRRASPPREQHSRGKFSGKQKDFKPKEGSPATTNRPTRDKNSITCYKCQKTGHYANECRSSNPNQIPVRVNQAGKGQASPINRQQ